MSFPRKTLAILALAAVSLGAFADQAASGWGTWFKVADLRLAYVGPSSVGPNHARVIVVNEGSGGADPCWVLVKTTGTPSHYGYYKLPAMSASSGVGVDVYIGGSVNASPGLVTEAYVDLFNQVPEFDENDNKGYYIAPAW